MKIAICGKGGSGKSTVTTLLAKELSAKNQKVLVIDCDESNYGLHQQLGMELSKDFTELFGGKKKVLPRMLFTIILHYLFTIILHCTISTPLLSSGLSKKKAFLYGAASGAVEPIGAIITLLLTSFITPVLPYILSFAAGAMLYVVIEELIPESQAGDHSNIGTIGAALGFALMNILDVALG